MHRTPLAVVLLAAAMATLTAVPAAAVTIHQHVDLPHGVTGKAAAAEVVAATVPPRDGDEDGVANADDPCPHTAGSDGGCPPPPPPAPIVSSTPSTIPAAPTTSTSGAYAIPSSIVSCESGGNWSAVNPSSGAGGAYQILPSTWRLEGGSGAPQDASPAEQSAIAAKIWADSGPSAWSCAGG
jgi:hypothetical protein